MSYEVQRLFCMMRWNALTQADSSLNQDQRPLLELLFYEVKSTLLHESTFQLSSLLESTFPLVVLKLMKWGHESDPHKIMSCKFA